MKNNLFATGILFAACFASSLRGFDFITDQRDSGTPLPIKWPPGSTAIQIKLGSTANLIDGNSFNTSAQGAAQMWNPVLGNLQITTSFAPESPAVEENNVNELVFASTIFGEAFEGNTIAVTTTWSRGNERTRADIIFNSNRTWNSFDEAQRPSGSVIDLQRVALHELGHLLGLDHPDEASPQQSVSAIMNSRISALDSLAADDVAGAQSLYGPPGVPSNDNFANAATITLPNGTTTVTGYTTNATKQAGEPAHAGNAGGHSIWWRWSAPSAGPVTVDTRGSYSDTTLGVYTGSALNNLTTIGSNDDISATPHVQASQVSFTATAGTTYFFAIDGFDGDSSGVKLNLSFTSTGPAVPTITTQPTSATVTTGGAVSFNVVASNATGYQWFFNGNSISGATTATFNLSSAQASNAGSYFVAVSNGAGSVNSDTVTLTVNAPPTPTPNPTPPSSGGGGGGGAPSFWFYGAVSLLALFRGLRRR